MARRKPTIKEIEAKVEALTNVNNIAIQMIENIGNSLKQYLEFKGDVKDFHEYQKEISEASAKIKGEQK